MLRGSGWHDDNSVTVRYPALHAFTFDNGRMFNRNVQIAVADGQFTHEDGWLQVETGFTYTITATGDQSGTVVTSEYSTKLW